MLSGVVRQIAFGLPPMRVYRSPHRARGADADVDDQGGDQVDPAQAGGVDDEGEDQLGPAEAGGVDDQGEDQVGPAEAGGQHSAEDDEDEPHPAGGQGNRAKRKRPYSRPDDDRSQELGGPAVPVAGRRSVRLHEQELAIRAPYVEVQGDDSIEQNDRNSEDDHSSDDVLPRRQAKRRRRIIFDQDDDAFDTVGSGAAQDPEQGGNEQGVEEAGNEGARVEDIAGPTASLLVSDGNFREIRERLLAHPDVGPADHNIQASLSPHHDSAAQSDDANHASDSESSPDSAPVPDDAVNREELETLRRHAVIALEKAGHRREQVEKLQSNLTAARSEASAAVQRAVAAETVLEDIAPRFEGLQGVLSNANERMESMQSQLQQALLQQEEMRKELQTAQEQTAAARRELEVQTAHRNNFDRQFDDFGQRFDDFDQNMQRVIEESLRMVRVMRGRVVAADEARQTAETDQQMARQQVVLLESNLQDAEESARRAEATRNRLRNQLQLANQGADHFRARNQQAHGDAFWLTQNVRDAITELSGVMDAAKRDAAVALSEVTDTAHGHAAGELSQVMDAADGHAPAVTSAIGSRTITNEFPNEVARLQHVVDNIYHDLLRDYREQARRNGPAPPADRRYTDDWIRMGGHITPDDSLQLYEAGYSDNDKHTLTFEDLRIIASKIREIQHRRIRHENEQLQQPALRSRRLLHRALRSDNGAGAAGAGAAGAGAAGAGLAAGATRARGRQPRELLNLADHLRESPAGRHARLMSMLQEITMQIRNDIPTEGEHIVQQTGDYDIAIARLGEPALGLTEADREDLARRGFSNVPVQRSYQQRRDDLREIGVVVSNRLARERKAVEEN